MAEAKPRDVTDPLDRFWTINQAAAHLGLARCTVERYVRDGLKVYFPRQGGYLDRDEFLAAYRLRLARRKATLGK